MRIPHMPPAPQTAYEHCRRLHRRHDPTYYWATRRLPRDVRERRARALRVRPRGRRDRRRPGARTRPESAPAVLTGCEARLRRRAGRRAVAGPGRDRARRRRPPPRPAAASELDSYFDSMRLDCGPVRMATWEELSATCTAAPARSAASSPCCSTRRPRAPRRLRTPRARLPAHQLHPRRARGLGARPRLPPGGGPRAPRRVGRRDRAARAHAPASAGWSRSRSGARARAVPRGRRRRPRWWRRRCAAG